MAMAAVAADENTSIFLTGLRNAHALETEAVQIIERQLDRLTSYPEMKQRIHMHLEETRNQQRRLEEILSSHGDSPSTFKEAALGFMGNVAALAHPNIRVITVAPHEAEFWDSPGTVISYVKMAAAAISNTRPEVGENRKVSMESM